ncbi:MAG: hypothetical protein EZS28_022685 [Streblomastix strix]|uniref:Uncharacterized protein n=1 Tax=Streblomastix strix TaxID=222440 RepID=A0A5J4VHF5_9EUKA|nr:MAG: hypothetical protein EZS28_022685 [Streblomastix strix]
MDYSQLLIPIIYIQDSNSLLELDTVAFSGIKLSPTTEAKGIIHIKYDNSQFIAQNCMFENINISSKGGNAIRILNSESYPITSTIKGCQFNNISSIGDPNGRGGSAIFMESKHGSQLIIDESCQFYKCICDNGNGGAIYIDIDFTSEFLFKISDTLIQECIAKENMSLSSPTGYGGGIFLTGSGDYDPSTKRLDLKGMKIYNNSADKSGQSLYVVMTSVKEWCRTGIAGEYVKGNYSDGISIQSELQGISVDSTKFNSYSSSQINDNENNLEDYWNLNRNQYFIRSNGSDESICTSSTPCQTLVSANDIKNNINSAREILVYIFDQTLIENTIIISQTTSPRIFRAYSIDSTQLSSIQIKENGRFNVSGKVRFQLIKFIMESTSLQQDNHGIYGIESTAEIDLQDCEFNMQNTESSIGKCFVNVLKGGNHAVSNLEAKDISNLENIIKIDFNEAGSLNISESEFENITKIDSSITGGIIRSALQHSSNKLDITDCIFTTCKAQGTFGGAIYAEIQNSGAQVILTRTQVLYCEASKGGGLFIKIDKQGKLILQSSCELKQCKATSGNGGGIYVDLTYSASTQTTFLINDGTIRECEAKANTSSSSPTGFGGGIFIGGTGDYIASTKTIDLKGMKIYNNSADKYGQSLYAVIPKLEDWCKYGTQGEYVKGDYDDNTSNLSELQGIPIDFETFNILSSNEIEEQQNYLQYYWSKIALISSVSSVINESNSDLHLIISLKGSGFIAGQLHVKIVELGPEKQHNKKLTIIQDNANDVIYPPEDGTGDPIDIQGDPQSEQEATFGIKDISWMDYENKNYGILTSNDKKVYTGIDGRQNKAVPMEIKVEEVPLIEESEVDTEKQSDVEYTDIDIDIIEDQTHDQQKSNKFPWFAIMLIIMGVIIAAIVIFAIIYKWHKYIQDQEERNRFVVFEQFNNIEDLHN